MFTVEAQDAVGLFQSQARCNPLCDIGNHADRVAVVTVSIPSEMQSPLRLVFVLITGPLCCSFNPKRDAIPFATQACANGGAIPQLFQSQARCNPLCDARTGRGCNVCAEFQSQARCNPLCDAPVRGPPLLCFCVSIPSEMQSPLRQLAHLREASLGTSFNPKRDAIPFATISPSNRHRHFHRFQSQARCNPLCDIVIILVACDLT